MPNLEKMPSTPLSNAGPTALENIEKTELENNRPDRKEPGGDKELSPAEKREAAMELFKEIKKQIETIMKNLGDDSTIINDYQRNMSGLHQPDLPTVYKNEDKLIIAERLTLRLQLEGALDWMARINRKRSPDINDIKSFAIRGVSLEDLKHHRHALYVHGGEDQKLLNRAVYSLIKNAEKLAAM